MGGVNEFSEAEDGISYLNMGFADGREEKSLVRSYDAVKEKIFRIDTGGEGLLVHCERGRNRYCNYYFKTIVSPFYFFMLKFQIGGSNVALRAGVQEDRIAGRSKQHKHLPRV